VSICPPIKPAWHLFQCIDLEQTAVVLVGNHNQLPCVGPGNLLRDLVQSRMAPTVLLDQVVAFAYVFGHQYIALPLALTPNHLPGILALPKQVPIYEKPKAPVIRRRKQEVLSDLPEQTVTNYCIELTEKQAEIHNGDLGALMLLLNKKFLTPWSSATSSSSSS
jgi:hypothetical protein